MLLHLEIEATIYNPNGLTLKMRDTQMDLLCDGEKIGVVARIDPLVLKAHTQKDYPLQCFIQMDWRQQDLNELFRLLMNDSQRLSLSGSVKVKSFIRNKTVAIEQPLP
jgi:LEA14-like dessication related protein